MKKINLILRIIIISALLLLGVATASAVTTYNVGQGGTGVNTITGIIKGNGTSPFTAIVSGTDIKTINSTTILGSGNFSLQPTITTGTTAQYFKGDLSLGTFPTALSSFTNDLGNYGSFEVVSNKATDFSTINNTLYPTVQATNTAINTATTGLLDYRGSYDTSTNLFPATGGSGLVGAILKSDFWICSVGGTLGGTAVTPGDLIIAIVDTPGQTAGNWDLIPHNLGSYVTSVSGTSNRVTSTGGSTPVIDISGSYVGQSSITTLGTVGTGVWHGTAIGDTYISSASTWNGKQSAFTILSTLGGLANASGVLTNDGSGNLSWASSGGTGTVTNVATDSTLTGGPITTTGTLGLNLGNANTWTAAQTFNDTKLLLENVAGTFSGKFTNTNTANRTYTLKDASGTLAFTSDITGTNSGTNTGDQTLTIAGTTSPTIALSGSNTATFAAGTNVTLSQAGGTITINSSGSSGISGLTTGQLGIAGSATTLTSSIAYNSTPTASTIAEWDANVNLSANNLINGWKTTSLAGGTTSMVVGDASQQYWTGASTNQTVKLPTTGVVAGQQYTIHNNGTGTSAVTVQSSGANTIVILSINTAGIFTALKATPTAAADWDFIYESVTAASGKIGSFTNSLTLAGTDGTTMTFPGSSKTIAANDGSNLTISGQAIGDIPVASSTTAYGKLADVTAGSFLRSGGTGVAPAWSTSTIPTSAGATANKVLLSDGTNYVLSTPTFPNASATSGKTIRSDGTNWIASTATLSDAPSTALKWLRSDGTNWITSTSTFSDSPGTASHFIVSDGTNWITSAGLLSVASTKTLTASNSLTLAGTDGTTMTFPGASTTVAGLGTTQTFTGINTFTPAARSSGALAYLTINAQADTGITTATEAIGINHVGATRTWVDGTVATQREYLFQAPTYNKTTTSATFTKAATLAVSAAPIAGTGVTITNPYAFWVQAGSAQFDGGLVSTTVNATTGFQISGAATSGKILVGNGTNFVASTPTFPNASATSGKTIRSDGTNWIASTATLSDAPSTALKWLRSDGTNWITSTATLSDTPSTAGKILVSDGTNWITSTPTFPNASATARKIIVSDGTNWTASTELWPIATTSGNYLKADGTNWVTTTPPTTATASAIMATDANKNFTSNNFIESFTTTATAAGTTSMAVGDTGQQVWTGSTTQTIKLPTTGVAQGGAWYIVNQSTGNITIQSSGANQIVILGAGQSAVFTAQIATPTTAANWTYALFEYVGLNNAITATTNAATINLAYKTNTVTNNSAATITITLPTAGAIDGEMRVVKILDFSAVAQTLAWTNTENSTTTAPVLTNGSTTLPVTAGFQYNAATSKWRCIASS